jgi:hypothetical protein
MATVWMRQAFSHWARRCRSAVKMPKRHRLGIAVGGHGDIVLGIAHIDARGVQVQHGQALQILHGDFLRFVLKRGPVRRNCAANCHQSPDHKKPEPCSGTGTRRHVVVGYSLPRHALLSLSSESTFPPVLTVPRPSFAQGRLWGTAAWSMLSSWSNFPATRRWIRRKSILPC